MSSFVEEFKKYQRQERLLTGTIVLVSVLTPISFTLLMNSKIHWAFSGAVAVVLLLSALWVRIVRNRVSQKLLSKYETLDVGAVLAKKVTPKSPRRFVITNRGYNHYCM